jgi:hypothetical protein
VRAVPVRKQFDGTMKMGVSAAGLAVSARVIWFMIINAMQIMEVNSFAADEF